MSLQGIRVIDLTRVISGPFCTALLADLGADVIKVETGPEGDPIRQQGVLVDGHSPYFANYNRNKRSVLLDLYSAGGRQALGDLIAGADVLVDNFRPDVMAEIGFPPPVLRTINPGLVACNINGFGADGPYANRPAFDFIVQAMSGFMSCNGGEADPPLRSGVPIADLVAGLYAALAITAALRGRPATGAGASLSVSMLHGLMTMLSFHATDYLNSGAAIARTGNDHGLVAPYGLFATRDGAVAIAPSNDGVYRKLLSALGLGELRADARFATNALRREWRGEINAAVEAVTRTAPSTHWIAVLNEAGVPCGPVYTLAEAFADPQVAAQGVAQTEVVDGRSVEVLSFPVKGGPGPSPRRAPPALGEHTDAVLREIGYDEARIRDLRGWTAP